MKNAVIIHGACDKAEYFSDLHPSLSNCHWLPWLQKQLLTHGILAQTPEMPEAYQPDYGKWQKEFERFDVTQDTIVVGHSCGAGFLVRWLSENKVNVGTVMLVAPWLDPSNRRSTAFFDFTIDPAMQDRAQNIHILISDNEDIEGIKESVATIKEALPKAHFHELHNMGHFCYRDMKTEKFPELLALI